MSWLDQEQREKPRMPAQVQREPIFAFRAWRIADSKLMSCTCDCVWQPRERMDARCNRNVLHGDIPTWNCHCGFYAYKTATALERSRYARLDQWLTVEGRVALWGRVIDHGLGYRAEHAYPQVLYLRGDRYDELIRRLAGYYAVECIPRLPLAS